jgi:hypothetical protein
MRVSAAAAGTAPAITNGNRPPMRVRSLSDHAPTNSGTQRAITPSLAMITPMIVVCWV